MTIFPFEEQLYRDAGVRADFVGHTMVRDIPETADRDLLRRELGLEPSRYADRAGSRKPACGDPPHAPGHV